MASKEPKSHGGEQFPAIFPGTTQKVAYTGTAAASAVFGAGVSIVRVVCTTDACIKFAASPTATTSDIFMPANHVEYFGVPEDGTYKVSAIQISSGGDMYVSEGSTT